MKGEEYTVVATSSKNASASVSLKHVLFGDVFICSGQSNMQLSLPYMHSHLSS